MKIIMVEYGRVIIASIVALLLFVIFFSIRMNGVEGVFQILGSANYGEVSLEQGNSSVLDAAANVNKPVIIWKEGGGSIKVATEVSIPELFVAKENSGKALNVEILSILHEGVEILVVTDENGKQEYLQNVASYVFEEAGIYQLRVRAMDLYGNTTTRVCKLVVNQ